MAISDGKTVWPGGRAGDESLSSAELFAQIARLTERAHRAPDRRAERRILRLRQLAGARFENEHDQLVDFPVPNTAALPDAPGLPEVGPEALTPALLRAAILRDGCLLVRGLVSRAAATGLACEIDRAFAERERKELEGTAEPGYYEEFWFDSQYQAPVRRWIKSTGGLLAIDSPKIAFELLEVFDEAGISDLVRGYLGPAVLSAEKTTLRKVESGIGGAWHQDGSFMGDVRSLNIWLSLSHCGDDAPGLDIVPRRLDALVPTGTEGALLPKNVSHAKAEEAAQGVTIARPIFEPGDAVLFDDLCLHRTTVDPSMTNTRFAVEAWFFAAAGLASMYAPIAIAPR